MSKGTGTLVRAREAAVERAVTVAVSSVLVLLPPWLVLPIGWIVGWIAHRAWSEASTLPWAVSALTAATIGLASLTWHHTHERGRYGRWHGTITAASAGAWLILATVIGAWNAVAVSPFIPVWWVALALTWNLRAVIRTSNGEPGGDRLRDLFAPHAKTVGLDGAALRTKRAEQHRVSAQMQLAGGKTADDVQKAAPAMESAMGMPPGSILATANEDRADVADMSLTDPRLLKYPVAWPGPYRPGGSICEPLRPGIWQDGNDVEYVMTGHHLQISGMTGAGKSFGGAWNLLGEVITRHDVAVFGADVTKGQQTLGPLAAGLHRLETTEQGARKLLAEVLAEVKARTDYLSGKGLNKWESGCGLTYWVVWLEECPDVLAALNLDDAIKLLRIARSAGISIVFSLQVATWDQLPTALRKLLYKMCFGLSDADDREFTLTPAQYKIKSVRPELWMADHQGMAYLHAPSIPANRIAMPLRTFDWGKDGHAQMTAHAAAFPAAAKQVCASTRKLAQVPRTVPTAAPATGSAAAADTGAPTPARDDHDRGQTPDDDLPWDVDGVIEEHVTTPDPNPANQAGLDEELPPADDEGVSFAREPSRPMTPQRARQVLYARIARWHAEGRDKFRVAELADLWQQAGLSRSWANKWVRELVKSGHLQHDEKGSGYFIVRAPDTSADEAGETP